MMTMSRSTAGCPIPRLRFLAPICGVGRLTPVAATLAVVFAIGSAPRAEAGPALTIGNVNTFKTSSSGTNPTGTWTLGDKDYTYVDSSVTTGTTGWLGFEQILLEENTNPSLYSHQFLIDSLSDYSAPTSLFLGYRVRINGKDGPLTFKDVSMSQIFSGDTVEVWKDVFGSLADYNANPGTNNGTLARFYFNSLVNVNAPTVPIPSGMTELWVRDTFTLSGEGGSISSLNNTFRQTIPEIDPNSSASVLGVVVGALGLLERRVRRSLGFLQVA